jgi:recombination protein RecT
VSNELAKQKEPTTVKSLLASPAMKARFAEVLKERAPQFLAAVTSQAAADLKNCEPNSVLAAAFLAATLNLPVNRELGYAWMIPYRSGNQTLAQFQIGYKGLVQLAQRTGQYQRLNAGVVTEGAYKGRDEMGEPIIDFNAIDQSKAIVGYFAAFRLSCGFTKVVYWSKGDAERHGKRFSKTFNNGPWKTDFDAMALKSVLKHMLSKWGPMSVEVADAATLDQSARVSIDSEPIYVDSGNDTSDLSAALLLGSTVEQAPLPTFAERITAAKTGDELQTIADDIDAATDVPDDMKASLYQSLNDRQQAIAK